MNKPHWTEIVGSLAQRGKFFVYPNLYKSDRYRLKFDICDDNGVFNSDRMNKFIPLSECTLLSRHISSVIEEERAGLALSVFGFTDFHKWYERYKSGMSKTATEEEFILFLANKTSGFFYLISQGILPPNISEEGVEFVNKKENE